VTGPEILDRIREEIEARGWSKVAEQSGVDRVNLHRVFGPNGRGRPNMTTLERVLPHLGLELQVTEARRA
jgi:DNA-binding phage protein